MATALSSIGEDVELVVRAEKLATHPERITLQQPAGFITASARAVSRLTEPVDVLWISTKAYQLRSALESIEASPKIVVPLLNGVDHIALLRSHFGDDRVAPATIAVEADRTADGHFVQRSIVRLSVAASGQALLRPVLGTLQQRLSFICHFVENEQTLMCTKLLLPGALRADIVCFGQKQGCYPGRLRMERRTLLVNWRGLSRRRSLRSGNRCFRHADDSRHLACNDAEFDAQGFDRRPRA